MHREAAVARLRVAGSGALSRLHAFLDSMPPPPARAAALSALDGSDDPRTIAPALSALDAPEPEVVVAALGVLRGWVAREDGTRVLDALARVALDGGRDARVRLAALDGLSSLPRDLVRPILEQAAPVDPRAIADDPARVREWVAAEGRTAPLSVLHELVVRGRERERADPSAEASHTWRSVRAAAHAALAGRGSRVALYDLRETFDTAAGPLPLEFLTAIAAVGDASCLEPMARAWHASAGEAWWRERLADTAAEIMHRTRLSGRSGVVRRVRARWPGFI